MPNKVITLPCGHSYEYFSFYCPPHTRHIEHDGSDIRKLSGEFVSNDQYFFL